MFSIYSSTTLPMSSLSGWQRPQYTIPPDSFFSAEKKSDKRSCIPLLFFLVLVLVLLVIGFCVYWFRFHNSSSNAQEGGGGSGGLISSTGGDILSSTGGSSSGRVPNPEYASVISWYPSPAPYIDSFGIVWSNTNSVSLSNVSVNLASSVLPISNTLDPAVFSNFAYSPPGETRTLIFALNSSLSYTLTILFAETQCQTANCRLTSVYYNTHGEVKSGVVSALDMYAVRGYLVARNFGCYTGGPLTASAIQIDIVSNVGSGAINALQLLPVGVTDNYASN
jgi:hypothetical protein